MAEFVLFVLLFAGIGFVLLLKAIFGKTPEQKAYEIQEEFQKMHQAKIDQIESNLLGYADDLERLTKESEAEVAHYQKIIRELYAELSDPETKIYFKRRYPQNDFE